MSSAPKTLHELFSQELQPTMGCIEPAALAFAAASATTLLGENIQQLVIQTDPATFKNTLSVGLPHATHQGPAIAAAAGAVLNRPEKALQILNEMTPQLWQEAVHLCPRVYVSPDSAHHNTYISAIAISAQHKAEVILDGRYDRISSCRRDGMPILNNVIDIGRENLTLKEIHNAIGTTPQILAAVENLTSKELNILDAALEANLAFLEANQNYQGYGHAILNGPLGNDDPLYDQVRGSIAAAIEVRMMGESQTVYASATSGNSGLTVTLGPYMAAQVLEIEDPTHILKAIAVAHLFNLSVRARIGRTGPLCGGTIGAALGVGCAILYLQGYGLKEMNRVVRIMINTVAGVLCDGAKPSCALKVANALSVALDATRLAKTDLPEFEDEGLAGNNATCSLTRLTQLVKTAYGRTDLRLTQILQEHPIKSGYAV